MAQTFPDHPGHAGGGALPARAVDEILSLVRARHGVDFGPYRRGTIERRIRNAMIAARAPSAPAYVVRLRTEPAESARLLGRLTVKVSRFYRDARAAEVVRAALAERIARSPGPLAAWSAGCGRGEEAYTLALLLAEAGAPAGPNPDVLATDVDPGALAAAAVAAYPEAALAEIPAAVRARSFERVRGDPRAPFRPVQAIRARVRLRLHDLTAAEAPPDRFDLVACRNTLIYFQPALQQRVLRLLRASLAPGGLLWLGEAEWPLGPAADGLAVIDRRARLFRLEEARDA